MRSCLAKNARRRRARPGPSLGEERLAQDDIACWRDRAGCSFRRTNCKVGRAFLACAPSTGTRFRPDPRSPETTASPSTRPRRAIAIRAALGMTEILAWADIRQVLDPLAFETDLIRFWPRLLASRRAPWRGAGAAKF